MPSDQSQSIRYVALGDSYTIGQSVSKGESFPDQLVSRLQKDGIEIELVANPSRTGWTTKQLIDNELLYVESERANFVTLLVGVNDWVQGVSADSFARNLSFILDRLIEKVGPNRVVVITIPDFSVMPAAAYLQDGRDISKGIAEFNAIISAEALRRNLTVVDIFSLSKEAKNTSDFISVDGLHPSAIQYRAWVELLYPVALALFKQNN